MSQHDYEITRADALSGAQLRAAINAALQALASNNSGSGYPSVTYANMIHINTATTNPAVLRRNALNTGWNSMFNLVGDGIQFPSDIVANNVTVGRGAHSNNGNVVCGTSCMAGLTTGTYNSVFGGSVLNNLNTGERNVAMGYNAGQLATSCSNNVYLGYNAASAMTTGDRNIFIGSSAARFTSALASITNASSSIYIGTDARPFAASGTTNEIVIGDTAIGAGSNTATLGSAATTKTVLSGVIQKRALDTAPASATATGTAGEIRVTATHIYVCTATNTWVRTALATW